MAISQVFSELGTGLRRNVSMTVSLVVTMTVSLLLASLGLVLQAQADRTEQYYGDRLQVQILLCTDNSTSENCIGGAATDEQRDSVEAALDENPEVKDVRLQTAAESLEKARELYSQGDQFDESVLRDLDESDFAVSYFVTLNDPQNHDDVESQVSGMEGVDRVNSLRELLGPLFDMLDNLRWAALGTSLLLIIAAIMQVSNTIRMTAYARRREIGIMRLVGASTWHIQMPFILESLVAALISAALACAGLAAFMKYVVYDYLHANLSGLTLWVRWEDATQVGIYTVILAIGLALIPTLVMTRKYLKV